jgi:hypothetical protein
LEAGEVIIEADNEFILQPSAFILPSSPARRLGKDAI